MEEQLEKLRAALEAEIGVDAD